MYLPGNRNNFKFPYMKIFYTLKLNSNILSLLEEALFALQADNECEGKCQL